MAVDESRYVAQHWRNVPERPREREQDPEVPDDKTAMALAMGVASSGAVSGVQTTVLVPASEAVEVMRKAGEVAGTYQPLIAH